MESHLYRIGLVLIAVLALQRVGAVLYFFVSRLLSYRKRAVAAPTSWSDLITFPEPPLLLAVTLLLWVRHSSPADPSVLQLLRVGFAAAIALGAAGLQSWTLRSFPGVSPGHYVLPEQRVVTSGPYAYVRHPLYLHAIIVWLSIALGFSSLMTLLVTLNYVIPAYIIYSRSEERMMLAHFGNSYRVYRQNVGGFLPRWRSASRHHHDSDS